MQKILPQNKRGKVKVPNATATTKRNPKSVWGLGQNTAVLQYAPGKGKSVSSQPWVITAHMDASWSVTCVSIPFALGAAKTSM